MIISLKIIDCRINKKGMLNMIKNEKYIRILKSMISCINQGDYYSIKELSNLELQKMKEDEEKNKKDIKKFRNNKKIRKNKEKPLENWTSEELKTLIENYSQFVLNKIEGTNNIKQLQNQTISIQEFINKM